MSQPSFEQHASDTFDALVPAVMDALKSPGVAQEAADLGVDPLHVYVAHLRRASREGRIFDAAVAAVCVCAHAKHAQAATERPSEEPPVGSGEFPELGGEA